MRHLEDQRECRPLRIQVGFTLVEMLVAVALGTIILAVIVTAFSQGSAVSSVANAKTEAVHNARVAMDLLERDLSGAFIEPTGRDFIGTRDDVTFYTFSGLGGAPRAVQVQYRVGSVQVGSVEITALLRNSTNIGGTFSGSTPTSVGDGVQRVYYYDEDGDGAADENEDKWIDDYNGMYDEGTDVILVSGPDGVTVTDGTSGTRLLFRYYYDGTWYGNWDSFNSSNAVQYRRIPEVVEVTLYVIDTGGVLAEEENSPITVRRLISLSGAE